MKPNDLTKFYKTQVAAGAAVGLSQSRVAVWQARGAIPIERQCQYELVTHGALKADREELRKEALRILK
jgi:hypothetical protein